MENNIQTAEEIQDNLAKEAGISDLQIIKGKQSYASLNSVSALYKYCGTLPDQGVTVKYKRNGKDCTLSTLCNVGETLEDFCKPFLRYDPANNERPYVMDCLLNGG